MNNPDSIKITHNPIHPGGAGGILKGGVCWGQRAPYSPLKRLFGYFLAEQKVTRGWGLEAPFLNPSEIPKNAVDS